MSCNYQRDASRKSCLDGLISAAAAAALAGVARTGQLVMVDLRRRAGTRPAMALAPANCNLNIVVVARAASLQGHSSGVGSKRSSSFPLKSSFIFDNNKFICLSIIFIQNI